MLDEKITKKCAKAFLETTIILQLKKKPMTGYELIKHFSREFHVVFSPSVVYLALYSMEREGLVFQKVIRRSRIYQPTKYGLKVADQTSKKVDEITLLMKSLLKG